MICHVYFKYSNKKIAFIFRTSGYSGKQVSARLAMTSRLTWRRTGILIDDAGAEAQKRPSHSRAWLWWYKPVSKTEAWGSSVKNTEAEMMSFWWNFRHWLHRKLLFWPATKISSKVTTLTFRRWYTPKSILHFKIRGYMNTLKVTHYEHLVSALTHWDNELWGCLVLIKYGSRGVN